jgi:hypothetical protein
MERQSNTERKPKVCRKLFFDEENENDAADPDDTYLQYINNLQKEMVQEAATKWNFDFMNEVPLEGDWEWEPVVQAEQTEEQTQPHSETDQGA